MIGSFFVVCDHYAETDLSKVWNECFHCKNLSKYDKFILAVCQS